jgi:hypothetical protein
MEEIHILIENSIPSNTVDGKEIIDIIEWPYCDAIELLQMNDIAIVETVFKKQLGLDPGQIMQMKAAEFCSVFRHLINEIEKIVGFLDLLKTEPDIDLVNAGIDKLDKFGVYNVYYAIEKNPTKWDEISEISFNKIFTRLYMDKEHGEIQKAYNKIIIDKHNRK